MYGKRMNNELEVQTAVRIGRSTAKAQTAVWFRLIDVVNTPMTLMQSSNSLFISKFRPSSVSQIGMGIPMTSLRVRNGKKGKTDNPTLHGFQEI
ncbi:hypothetical protein E3N88_46316 [Mikania micrantha]|uniref:Uncharacterized protein n=1 Tax=Mikania micrantha TaxID=192012 RepID=A0A5N6L6P0_9ASTR|nr:hypothetical protein E3N88_46316 [Mikania micrantha]